MLAPRPHTTERYAAIGCVSLGLAVSALLAPKDSFFLPNFAFFWVPQLGVLAFAWFLKSQAAIVAGVAFALAVYLAAFGVWASTHVIPDGSAWVGYIFSLPGAVVGTVVAATWLRRHPDLHPLVVGSLATGVVLAGVVLNQAIVMYSLGK